MKQSQKLRESIQLAKKQVEELPGSELSVKQQAWVVEALEREAKKRGIQV